MLWIRDYLNKAAMIKSGDYIDATENVHDGELPLGSVSGDIKQIFTLIQLVKRKRNLFLVELKLPGSIEAKKEMRGEAVKLSIRLKRLEEFLLDELQERFNVQCNIEMRKKFTPVWCQKKSSEDF